MECFFSSFRDTPVLPQILQSVKKFPKDGIRGFVVRLADDLRNKRPKCEGSSFWSNWATERPPQISLCSVLSIKVIVVC